MKPARFDVTGIGNAIVDVISQEHEGFLFDHLLAKGGMTLIDEARAEYLYAQMDAAIETSGGTAGNTMAGIASLGGKGCYIGKVKNDLLGKVFAHDIRATGCHFETKIAETGPATGRCLIVVTPDAERTMNTFLGASQYVTVEDIDPEIIQESKITYMEGYLWDRPECKQAFLEASKLAKQANRLLSLSLSDRFCVDRHRAEFLDLAEHHVDVLFANEEEIRALYECDFDTAVKKVSGHCKYACLTRGEKGSVILHDGKIIEVPSVPVSKVVDTTGAGDLYAAGFLFGITNGYSARQAGEIAALSAAEVITHMGPRPQKNLNQVIAAYLQKSA